jgi:hypothetical protein
LSKFDTNTERGKVQNTLWKKRASRNILFFYKYRDKELVYIDVLTILSVFPIISIRQIEDLGAFNHRFTSKLFELETIGCLKIYFFGHEEYDNKKLLLPNLYEKGMIIESMDLIKEIYNGAVFDMPKFRKISLAQLRRKTKTPYRVNNRTVIVEVTNKGKLLLNKYSDMYRIYFGIKIGTIDTKFLGLFTKSVDELKKIIQKDDILSIMAQNAANRNEKKYSHSNEL